MLNKRQKKSSDQKQHKPIRLWPGVLIVILQWLIRFGVPIIWPEAGIYFVFGGMFGGLAIIVWWVFFSRAPKFERWVGVGLIIVTLVVMQLILHESMRLLPFFAHLIPSRGKNGYR